MSIWSSATATVTVPLNSKFSVKKYVSEQLQNEDFTVAVEQSKLRNRVISTAEIQLRNDGTLAFNTFARLFAGIKQGIGPAGSVTYEVIIRSTL